MDCCKDFGVSLLKQRCHDVVSGVGFSGQEKIRELKNIWDSTKFHRRHESFKFALRVSSIFAKNDSKKQIMSNKILTKKIFFVKTLSSEKKFFVIVKIAEKS